MRVFEFKTDCLFNGEEARAGVEKSEGAKFRREIYELRITEMRDKVITRTLERGDECDDIVLSWANSVIDLVAAET